MICGAHLALGAPCAADSQCATRACRCPHTFKRRAETCPATGKVCTMLLPVGAECEEHRSCVSRKCYCETDPWKQDDCSGGLRKCCYWSWGYWECEGAFFVETKTLFGTFAGDDCKIVTLSRFAYCPSR